MNGPSMSSNNGYQFLWMDPLSLLKMAADVHEWAQCSYQELLQMDLEWAPYHFWKMLPMSTIVLSNSTKKCCKYTCMGPLLLAEKHWQWPRMGPVLLSRNAANMIALTHNYCWKILPMTMNGSSASTKKCCQFTWMGPSLLLIILPMATNWPCVSTTNFCRYPWMSSLSQMKNATDGHEWTQCFYQELLPIPLDGPSLLLWHNLNGHERGQCFCIELLLMPLNGPIIAADNDCRWPQIGPVFLPRNAVDTLGWALYRCWEMLLMATNGPKMSRKKCCRYTCMGPLLLLKDMPIATDEPSVATKTCCWCNWMGPLSLQKYPADSQ